MNTYQGSCHCGKVRYSVEADLGKPVIACNCSMCSRKGHLLSFVPAGQFQLLQGEENLQDYQFNKKVIHHLFCKTCGVSSFARGSQGDQPMVAINVRCLDGVDPSTLQVQQFDGKSY